MMNEKQTACKQYGVSEVYPMSFEKVKPNRWNQILGVNTYKDGELYHAEIYSEDGKHRVYVGKGYNRGDRFFRHGKGKEFWPNGNLRYDGDFMHDMACGNCKIYFEDGTLCYAGEVWLNQWYGKGVSYREDGTIHIDGIFADGIVNGFARVFYECGGLSYEGETKDGAIHGQGRKYNEDGTIYYEGTANMGNPDGFGRAYHPNGMLMYEGEIKSLKLWGYGRKYHENGKLIYEGEFVDGEYSGQGRLYDPFTGKLIREGVFHEVGNESVQTEGKWEDITGLEEDDEGISPQFCSVEKEDKDQCGVPTGTAEVL